MMQNCEHLSGMCPGFEEWWLSNPLTLKPANSFLKNKVCNTCTEECVLAARVRNPMGFYYT